jgi:hypothetical protein
MLKISKLSFFIFLLLLFIWSASGQVAVSSPFDIIVIDSTGNTVAGARVMVYQGQTYVDGGPTNSDGIFRTDLTKGLSYTIYAKNGTSSISTSIVANPNYPEIIIQLG